MNCLTCGDLITLGVYVVEGNPEAGMICWPCHLKGHGPQTDQQKAWMAQIINNRSEEE